MIRWLWRSNKKQDDKEQSPSTQSPQSSASDAFPPSTFPPTENAETKTPLTRDEAANADFLQFLKDTQNESSSQAPASLVSRSGSQPAVPYPVPESTPTSTPITATTIHPTTMSCRAAFDLAFYCQSVGGQFNSIYRQGTWRNCGYLWGDFWFCVRTNRGWMSDKERQDRFLNHFKKRERKYADGPSSEDVWEPRETMVVGAFEKDWEAVETMAPLVRRPYVITGLSNKGNEAEDSDM
ncbi:hypothetical protein MMC07_001651 [Pseudocyphellaria aurata]|nr:hypothetical protein [Pseudocyphellaria aurata]